MPVPLRENFKMHHYPDLKYRGKMRILQLRRTFSGCESSLPIHLSSLMKVAPLFIHLSNFPPFPYSSPVRKPQCEFHILAEVRDRYQFDESLFSSNGNVIFPNFHAARVFAKKLNDKRDLVKFPDQTVKAGKLNAIGLIDEI